uniref:E3 ubiquitin-protein ligase RNF170 n=1 Tax=Anthurium amnicola TaxID=1678845 RepID=A0A1D1Y3J6_9ARAE
MDAPPENDCCSVCHDSFNLPCQANCSHWFCGECILRVWHHGSALQACKCPICRRLITLLVPSEVTQHQHRETEVGRVLENIQQYNRFFGGGSRSLNQRLRDLPFFLGRLLRELMDPQRSLPLVVKAQMIFVMVVSAIYVLSPVDILPEGVLGVIGLIDDFLVLLIVFLHLSAIYRSVLLNRHGGRT